MDVYRTEEEQIEAIKKWWRTNGSSVVTALVVSLAVVFGWRIWQDHSQSQVEVASPVFQDLLEASQKLMTAEQTVTPESIEVKSVESFANTLLEEHSDTRYALHALLLLAKKAVMLEEYDAAERYLKDVLRKKPEAPVDRLVRYRLAKVLMAQENYTEALEVVSLEEPEAFKAAYEELKGDISLLQDNKAAALAHYKKALEFVKAGEQGQEGSARPMLEMKYFDLAGDVE